MCLILVPPMSRLKWLTLESSEWCLFLRWVTLLVVLFLVVCVLLMVVPVLMIRLEVRLKTVVRLGLRFLSLWTWCPCLKVFEVLLVLSFMCIRLL